MPRTFTEAWNIGVGSLFIVLLISGFAGAVTALQARYQFTGTIPIYYLAGVIVESIVLELGPVLTALVLAGRIGARYAAELGTMRVTEQIDALESLGRSPASHLILPRVVAGLIMIPVLTILADVMGIGAGLVLDEAGAPDHRRGLHLRRPGLLAIRSTRPTRSSRRSSSRRRSRSSPATWASTPSRAPRASAGPPPAAVVTSSVLILLLDVLLAQLLLSQ